MLKKAVLRYQQDLTKDTPTQEEFIDAEDESPNPPQKEGAMGPAPPSTEQLAKDKLLTELVEKMINKGGLIGDYLQEGEALLPGVTTTEATKKGKKPFSIPDYVRIARASADEDEKLLFFNEETGSFERRGRQKPLIANVMLSQWIGAEARILVKMIEEGLITSVEGMKEHLVHMEKIGDLSQTNTVSSVMVYDQEYRKNQAARQFSWQEDEFHLQSLYLVERKPNAFNSAPRGSPGPQAAYRGKNTPQRPPRLNKVCYDFQNESGCQRPTCRYTHACIVEGCGQSHPQYLHTKLTGTANTNM
jgi:hypothetical protein